VVQACLVKANRPGNGAEPAYHLPARRQGLQKL